MADIASDLAQTVIFLFDDAAASRPIGTAFLVETPVPNFPGKIAPVIVTARQVIDGLSSVTARYSTSEGKTTATVSHDLDRLRSDGDFWAHPDPGVDIAAFRIPVYKDSGNKRLPQNLIATRKIFADEDVKPTDRVIFPCLLTHFMGTTRNYPVTRDGMVSLIPDEPVPLKIDYRTGPVDTSQHVLFIDATSIPGASGAPVFLWPGPRLKSNSLFLGGGTAYLLGVMHGFYFAAPRPGFNATVTDATVPVFAENSRIAIAFPGWRLLEILESSAVTARISALAAASGELPPTEPVRDASLQTSSGRGQPPAL